ncbi:MAG: di-trans,poly-cis-decaprenylcistransferase [Pseudomonadales bacterium]|nr:di-trans,poly-cis-decaprenylcistransferase [Pseudomonadales bacterium]
MASTTPAVHDTEPALGLVPKHVCIIMDGNHRWAKRKHLPGAAGHRAGANRLRQIAEVAANAGVKNLTLFAFSTENWGRPSGEVSMLMDLMRHVMDNDIAELDRRGVRLRVIGNREKFAPDIQAKMRDCEELTAKNEALNLSVAVNFGGRWDIVQAAQRLAQRAVAGEIQMDEIDEMRFGQELSLAELPEPDLLIRTGGEFRVSNFLLWDLAYTELYFTETFWPDFDDDELGLALTEFASRARRFGKRG